MPQTILVNFTHLNPLSNGGTSRIGFHVARLLLKQPGLRPVFVVNSEFAPQFEQWLGMPAAIVPIVPLPKQIPLQIAQIKRALSPRLVVSPLFGMDPFSANNGIKHIAGMPDTLALDRPDYFSSAERLSRRQIYENLRGVDRVVPISRFAAESLQRHLQLAEERVVIAPLGGKSTAQPDDSLVPSGRYWLYPANLWPHKRHELLLRAFAAARLDDSSLQLVLTGDNRQFQNRFDDLIKSLNLPENSVRHLGYVSDSQLAALYRGAAAMVFTSEYEGFGMPLLEAMQAGCPVICAPVTAIPEVVGDAVLYVDSDDPAAWSRAALELNERRGALIAAGRARVNLFSWDYTCEQWLKALLDAGMKPGKESPVNPPASQAALNELSGRFAGYAISGRGRRAQILLRLWRLQQRILANAVEFTRA